MRTRYNSNKVSDVGQTDIQETNLTQTGAPVCQVATSFISSRSPIREGLLQNESDRYNASRSREQSGTRKYEVYNKRELRKQNTNNQQSYTVRSCPITGQQCRSRSTNGLELYTTSENFSENEAQNSNDLPARIVKVIQTDSLPSMHRPVQQIRDSFPRLNNLALSNPSTHPTVTLTPEYKGSCEPSPTIKCSSMDCTSDHFSARKSAFHKYNNSEMYTERFDSGSVVNGLDGGDSVVHSHSSTTRIYSSDKKPVDNSLPPRSQKHYPDLSFTDTYMSISGPQIITEKEVTQTPIVEPLPPYSSNESNGGTNIVVSYSGQNYPNKTVDKPMDVQTKLDSSPQCSHVGLKNHGNTCYMSVIFQCLRFSPSVHSFLTGSSNGQNVGKLFMRLGTLLYNMAQMATEDDLYENVEAIRSSLGSSGERYLGSDQQDATEFLTCLLDALHSEIKSPRRTESNTDDSSNVPALSTETRATDKDGVCHDSQEQLSYESDSFVPRKLFASKGSTFRRFIRKKSARKYDRTQLCVDTAKFNQLQLNEPDRIHPAVCAWEEGNISGASFIRDTFMSQLQSYRKCSQCDSETLCFSVVWNLGVPIPQHTPSPSGSNSPSNLKAQVETTKRYGGSPSPSGQTGNPRKFNILYDGSSIGVSTDSPNTWPKRLSAPGTRRESNGRFNDPSAYTPPTGLINSVSATVDKLPCSSTSGLTVSPVSSAPPAYSATTSRPIIPAVPLKKCLDVFMSTEILDGTDSPMCAKCKRKNPCELQHRISRLPEILIIQLLRFQSGEGRQKVDVPVEFPNTLNMEEYTHSDYEHVNKFVNSGTKDGDSVYWLYAVVYHDGAMSFGHYTTACRTTTGSDPSLDRWHLFNDQYVREIKLEEVHRSSAYLLFYERNSLYQQRKNTQIKPIDQINCIDARKPRVHIQSYQTRV